MLFVTFAIEISIMLGSPIGLWVFLAKKHNIEWGLILAGAVAFVASQIVHIPLNYALGFYTPYRGVALLPLPTIAFIAGLTAGLCEELARFIVFKFWKKDARSWIKGISYGAGHGGVESVILGLVVLGSFIFMLLVKTMGAESLGIPQSAAEQLNAQAKGFWSVPWYMPIFGGLERVFAITIQIALSLMVLLSIVRKNILWLVGAILAHTIVDGVSVLLKVKGYSTATIELVVFGFALLAFQFIFHTKEMLSNTAEEEPIEGTTD